MIYCVVIECSCDLFVVLVFYCVFFVLFVVFLVCLYCGFCVS